MAAAAAAAAAAAEYARRTAGQSAEVRWLDRPEGKGTFATRPAAYGTPVLTERPLVWSRFLDERVRRWHRARPRGGGAPGAHPAADLVPPVLASGPVGHCVLQPLPAVAPAAGAVCAVPGRAGSAARARARTAARAVRPRLHGGVPARDLLQWRLPGRCVGGLPREHVPRGRWRGGRAAGAPVRPLPVRGRRVGEDDKRDASTDRPGARRGGRWFAFEQPRRPDEPHGDCAVVRHRAPNAAAAAGAHAGTGGGPAAPQLANCGVSHLHELRW